MLASKLSWIYFQLNSIPRAPTQRGRSLILISSAMAHPDDENSVRSFVKSMGNLLVA